MMAFLAPVILMVVAFVMMTAGGILRGTDDARATDPLLMYLAAALLLILQAILWVRFGVSLQTTVSY